MLDFRNFIIKNLHSKDRKIAKTGNFWNPGIQSSGLKDRKDWVFSERLKDRVIHYKKRKKDRIFYICVCPVFGSFWSLRTWSLRSFRSSKFTFYCENF